MKLKTIMLLLLATILSAGVTTNPVSWNSGSVHLKIDNYQYKKVTMSDRNEYDELVISDLSEGYDFGKPDVPVKYFLIAAPVDGEISVQVTYSNSEMLNGINLKPAQVPPTDLYNGKVPEFNKDEAAFAESGFSPRDNYRISPKMVARGIAFYQVAVYPIRYNPASKEALIYRDTELRYSVSGNFSIDERLYFPAMHEQMFANCLNDRYLSQIERKKVAAKTAIDGEYLIITHPDFRVAADKFAAWKKQLGFYTKVVDLTETGNTEPQIVAYIKNAYTTWNKPPKYILLVGDAGNSTGAVIMPTGYHTVHPYHNQKTGTDLYYAAVDGTDWLPDLSTGRILCDTQAEALNQIDRIISYEKTPPEQDSFYQNVVNACYFQDDDNNGYADRRFAQTSEEMRNYLMTKLNKTSTRVYYAKPTVTPTNWNNDYFSFGEPVPAELLKSNGFLWNGSAADITAKINEGAFLVTHRDHGSYIVGWGEPRFTPDNARALTNGNKTPVVFSINCETAWFDNETDIGGLTPNEDQSIFVENWMRNTNGGAVGFVGATRVSYSGQNDYFVEALLNGTTGNLWTNDQNSYGDDFTGFNTPTFTGSENQPGVALNYAKMYILTKFSQSSEIVKVLFEQMIYMGDPSMRIRLQKPTAITMTCPPEIFLGNSDQITIATGVANATVSLYKENDLFISGIADASGNYVCSPFPLDPGSITVTASAKNRLPAVKTIDVQQGTMPLVTFLYPVNNQFLIKGNSIQILANASDPQKSVTKVEFFVDDLKIGEDSSAPYAYEWNTETYNLGTHTLKVLATDDSGETNSRQITVTLAEGLPLISILEPAEGQIINSPSIIDIKVNCSDPAKSVQKVEFFLDGNKLGEDLSAPYSYLWNTSGVPGGNHLLKATVTDDLANVSYIQINISINSLIINEPFSNNSFPAGWTQQNIGTGITNRWSRVTSNKAGGDAGEMCATFQSIDQGTTRLISPAVSTADVLKYDIKFKHMLDDYAAGATLKIQSSSDLTNWKDESWSLATAGNTNVGPATVSLSVTPEQNTQQIYFAWVITGNLFKFDKWYVDNVEIARTLSSSDISFDIIPTEYALAQNFPNPFNPTTTISFALPTASELEIGIYNIKGELVKTIAKGEFAAGNHKALFDASGYNSGMYFYRLSTKNKVLTGKMMLIK